jgi:nitric oxide reductase NorE protein
LPAAARRLPGEAGVWVFIFGDLLMFGLFFLTYMAYRADDPALYRASQLQLNRGFGLFNTLLLLGSSLAVALAVQDARAAGRRAPALILAAMACGAGFCAVKAVEYTEKIAAGITLNSNPFFMFYFAFTGIHLLHVLIGLGVLGFMLSKLHARDAGTIGALEGGGAFWHLVDLLWVVLFALFYLVR